MKLVKQLTEIYIAAIRRPKHLQLPLHIIHHLCDALLDAQKLLSDAQRKQYTKWHQTKWPNLDW